MLQSQQFYTSSEVQRIDFEAFTLGMDPLGLDSVYGRRLTPTFRRNLKYPP